MALTSIAHPSLDRQFQEQADRYGIGVTKLKTVYFRGVEEFNSSAFEMGTPTMWGLARVQRFINAVSTGAPLMSDSDLLEEIPPALTADGIEFPMSAAEAYLDVLVRDGSLLTGMFAPGEVFSLQLNDDLILVDGTLDGKFWSYTLNTTTGEQDLSIDDTV